MGLIKKLFGDAKKDSRAGVEHDNSAEKAFLEGTLQTVKLASVLMAIVGKWLVFFERLGHDKEAIALLSEKEVKCLVDNFTIKWQG